MEGLSRDDLDALVENVMYLFQALPSADGRRHSAWSRELVGLLLRGMSSASVCPLAESTINAYVRQFDESQSLLLQQQYRKGVKRRKASAREDDVREHLYARYQAAKSGDRSVSWRSCAETARHTFAGSSGDRHDVVQDVPGLQTRRRRCGVARVSPCGPQRARTASPT